ncbi:hypothetical protein BGX27_003377 [Mortierella sp. AM989]|nr:hypothetical protein BGX27_003377 [Mortierella sp. AM989]
MTTIHVIAPAPMANTIASTKKGLASIRTIFGTSTVKRHNAPSPTSANGPTLVSSPATSSSSASISSLFPSSSPKRASMDRAAERDWKEQAKQVFQLSTINDQGNFMPLTPNEKGYTEDLKDPQKDYFATIISTPPERVRTFLSTESTISPGMFSLPSSKIKRHTIPSFSPLTAATAQPVHKNNSSTDGNSVVKRKSLDSSTKNTSSAVSAAVIPPSLPQVRAQVRTSAPSESLFTPPASPPAVPSKDAYFLPSPPSTPRPQQQQQQSSPALSQAEAARRKSRAQISFLTGSTMEEEENLSDALADSLSSLQLSSSLPDLIMDEEGDRSSSGSGSSESSPNTSPRHSVTLQKEQVRKMNAQKLRAQNNFESELHIAH